MEVLRRSLIFSRVTREDLPRDRKNAFDPRAVNPFDLAGLGDGDVFWGFRRDLTLGGDRNDRGF